MGQKFRRNRSISLRFRDKRVLAFNAVIEDGRQNDFCEKWPVDSQGIPYGSNISLPVDSAAQKFRPNRSISLRF